MPHSRLCSNGYLIFQAIYGHACQNGYRQIRVSPRSYGNKNVIKQINLIKYMLKEVKGRVYVVTSSDDLILKLVFILFKYLSFF